MKVFEYISVLILFCCGFAVLSQPQLEYKRTVARFPDEKMVMVKNNKMLNVEIIDGKLSVISNDYEECIFLDNHAGMYSERSLHYTCFDKIEKVNAYTLVPEGNKYKKIKIREFKTDSILSRDVFYDGTSKISFFYPSLQQGAKSVLEYKKSFVEPRLIGSYFFQKYIPVLESEYVITIPDKVNLGWELFNVDDSSVDFTVEQKKAEITYRWKMKNLDKYDHEAESPNVRHSMPHIIAWIKSYETEEKENPVFNNIQDLYNWYYSITKEVNNEFCRGLKSTVDSLIPDEKNEMEKVRKIFYWVQDNVKYIAVEEGMGGFVPRSAKTVFEKRYGDCKDMASILNTMLGYAGIRTSYLTWIGSRDIPYNYSQLPNPSVDNHMIVTYINNEKYYFLDATGQNIPMELPTPFIQGKEALIGIDSARFLIKQVPVITTGINRYVDSIEVSIDKTNIIGREKSIFHGYYDYSISEYLLGSPTDHKKLLRDYFIKGNNKFVLDSFNVGDLDDRDRPLEITCSFNIGDYVKKNDNELYVNLVLDKSFQEQDIKSERRNDIEKRYNGIYESVIRFTIPEGYMASHVPLNSSFSDEKFGFDVSYDHSGNTIVLHYSAFTNILILRKSDFELWNEMIKKLRKASSEMVVLKKI